MTPTHLFKTGNGTFQLSKNTTLEIKNARFTPATYSTFYDYLHAGLKLKFRLAIDFSTSSFDDHNAEQSPYEDSIRALGSIMKNFDDDGKIPTYAYCNQIPNKDSFWQMLNENGDHELNLGELLEIYYENVDNHEFEDGKVDLAKMIGKFLGEIKKNFTGIADEYHVAVLLNSGCCDDIGEVIDLLEAEGQHLPFSLIIVGVGSNSFWVWEGMKKKLNRDVKMNSSM